MQSDVSHLTLQDQFLTWFEKNKRQLMFGTVAVAVIGLIAGIYVWRQNETQVDASQALSKVASIAYVSGTQAGMTEALLKVANDYAGTEAARRAVLMAAGNYFADGNYKDAQTQFEKFLRDYRDSAFAGQALLGVAACKDAQGKVEDAVAAYKDIADHHSADSVAPQARFALGRLYEQQKKPELARELYQQVAQMDPNGSIGSEAGMRLAELYSKNPSLIPAKVPAMARPAVAPAAQP
jgi:predicted negative regulator of RcsB-dependent stress response